jgi:predicted esterase
VAGFFIYLIPITMKEKSLEFTFKARYYQLGNLNAETRQIWFVLHGYGQLARYFSKKFTRLTDHNICIIAPEGLSRFYLEPVESRALTGNNRVGATWMTAENRLMDIENYITFLNAVHSRVMSAYPDTPLTLLGFSQGVATASRWAIHNPELFTRIILWAGIFPQDMDFTRGKEILSKKEVVLVYGNQDPYITDQRLAEITHLTNKMGIQPPVITFEGGHEIDEATLVTLC